MNISFKGANSIASGFSMGEHKGDLCFSHTLVCKVNNEKTPDKSNLQEVLSEYKYSRIPAKNDIVVLSVHNKISEQEILDITTDLPKFLEKKYTPQGDFFTLNFKPIEITKNKKHVFENINNLVKNIGQIKPIELLFAKSNINDTEMITNLLGGPLRLSAEELNAFLKKDYYAPKHVQFGVNSISKSLTNAIKRIG